MSLSSGRLRELAISDTGFVFDPYSGTSFSTNAAGIVLLECLKRGDSRAEIIEAMHREFEVVEDEDDLTRDIDEFLRSLRQHHIVDRDYRLD
jgi:PqqD family protein of HPr-rel-A system